jgi:hypothetical protein
VIGHEEMLFVSLLGLACLTCGHCICVLVTAQQWGLVKRAGSTRTTLGTLSSTTLSLDGLQTVHAAVFLDRAAVYAHYVKNLEQHHTTTRRPAGQQQQPAGAVGALQLVHEQHHAVTTRPAETSSN